MRLRFLEQFNMTQMKYVNGGDNMVIDGQEAESPEKKNVDVIPDGFNANYLKVYYGDVQNFRVGFLNTIIFVFNYYSLLVLQHFFSGLCISNEARDEHILIFSFSGFLFNFCQWKI